MFISSRLVSCVVASVLILVVGVARAQDLPQFSDSAYNALADASSDATIPPGTVITPQNWQQYKQFMTIGMQLLFSGKYQLKFPSDAQIAVAATQPIPLPKLYMQNTEKYASQVKLVKQDNGGYHVEGYVAGQPFPNVDLKDPLAAYKIMYNEFYRYTTHVKQAYAASYTLDRFGNLQKQLITVVYRRLAHLSDPDVGLTDPKNDGYDMIQYLEVTAPEQSRYSTTIKTFSDDPTAMEQIFSYTPSLRRAIRLSSQSRCAPAVGGDTLFDDTRAGFGIHPSDFSARIVGQKKILLGRHIDNDVVNQVVLAQQMLLDDTYRGLLWPKPVIVGPFELYNVTLMDYRRLPAAGADSYCYGSRIVYLPDTYDSPAEDLYDIGLKYWKVAFVFEKPTPIPGTGGDVYVSDGDQFQFMADLQNAHVTDSPSSQLRLDSDVPAQYRDNVERYGWPSGLDQITQ